MKLSSTPTNLNNLSTVAALANALAPWISQVSEGISNPSFTITDNLKLTIIPVTFVAGQSVSTSHPLGIVPNGYILVGSNVAMSVFAGSGVTNTQQISLQSNTSGKAQILLF